VTPRALTDAEVEELLGAYALHACDPDEAAAIEAVLLRRTDLAREAARLSRAAAWLGLGEAREPPRALGDHVLGAAFARRRARPVAVVDLYLSLSDGFERAAIALPPSAYDTPTPNGLTAHDLVVHMAAQESLLAQHLGVPTLDGVDETDVAARTHELLPRYADVDLDEALDLWRRSVEANRASALARGVADPEPLPAFGLDAHDTLVVRAFEAWIHTDDLRRAAQLDVEAPAPQHLAIMSDFAGRILPVALDVSGHCHAAKTARLVLTGAGGGEWVVPMQPGQPAGEPDVTVTADVIDWCLLMGERRAPDELPYLVDGDAALARDLVAAAPALAML